MSPRSLLLRLPSVLVFTAALFAGAPAHSIDAPSIAVSEQAAAIADATSEAQKWLQGIESGHLDESWSGAAAVFREGISREDWIEQLRSMRLALGRAIIREMRSADFSSSVRGAPTGEYVTLVFLTQFEKAPPALETVIMAKAPDGSWRMAGYNIGAAPASGT